MPVKLTDREVTALAKKIADKRQSEASKKLAEAAKRKMPEAKKIWSMIQSLPSEIIEFIDETRYDKGKRSVQGIANRLARMEKSDVDVRSKDYEPDVVLAAHGCNTMSQLCEKLGI